MQDNTVVYTATVARYFPSDKAIRTITWPSPGDSHIETVWNTMKTKIHNKYGDSQISR